MDTDKEYMIAYTAIRIYCADHKVDSLCMLLEDLWPQMQDRIYVRLDVFRIAARDVLWETRVREKSLVLDNEECATLLASARSVSS